MISFPSKYLSLIPLLPLLGFVLNSLLALTWARRKKPGAETLSSLIGCFLPLTSFVITAWAFLSLVGNHQQQFVSSGTLFTWMPTQLLTVNFSFMMDHLAAVMTLVVTGVGTLIHFYSIGYMKGDQGYARYFSYLNLFLFFMLVLVLGDNLLVMFVGWEGVGLCSYLLIGFWFTDAEKAYAGKKAFVVNRIGDFGFLIGIFIIVFALAGGSGEEGASLLSYSYMEAHKELLAPLAVIITLCMFVGATGKSAQIPLYVWLPDAMAGPTPVSALIHAATMVTAGIYMVARMHFLFDLAPFTLDVIACVGLATALMAAIIALTQYDIKKVLAYSTVSQLGFMFLALGMGAYSTAIFHLVTHAFFKACLFLCAGSVIHAVHDQDIRNMGGLFKKMPITAATFLISTLAIAGLPPLAGFFSKDEILWFTYFNGSLAFYLIAVLTAGLTAFYMVRLFVYSFIGDYRGKHGDKVHESSLVMTVPLIILATLATIGGFIGVPEVLGGSNHIQHWLSNLGTKLDSHGDYHAIELGLMGASTAWVLLLSGVSYLLYTKNLNWALAFKGKFKIIYNFIYNKFKVDEIYNTLIIRPIYWISKNILWKATDEKIIDGVMVHGFTDAAGFSARIISRLQNGVLGSYVMYLWVGLILLLILAVR